jgi:hypothetical protein
MKMKNWLEESETTDVCLVCMADLGETHNIEEQGGVCAACFWTQ